MPATSRAEASGCIGAPPSSAIWICVNSPSQLMGSQLVAELAQHLFARRDVGFGLDAFALHAVDHPEDAAPAVGLGHHDLDRVSRRAVDRADLGHGFDRIQD